MSGPVERGIDDSSGARGALETALAIATRARTSRSYARTSHLTVRAEAGEAR